MPRIVWIPKGRRTAYDPERPLEKNALIQSQVQHFHEAERYLPSELRTGIDIATIRTEGAAANYVAAVTNAIHKQGGRPRSQVKRAP
jgi:hypothetical protein